MKTLCKNRTPEKQLKLCNTITILMLIGITILVIAMIIDLVNGESIDSSRVAIICCDVSVLCLNIANRRNAQALIDSKNKDNQEEE